MYLLFTPAVWRDERYRRGGNMQTVLSFNIYISTSRACLNFLLQLKMANAKEHMCITYCVKVWKTA